MGKDYYKEYVPYGITHAEYQKTWASYCANRDLESRNRLILWNQRLLRFTIAFYMSGIPKEVPDEDLLGYGQIGLIEALERYDPQMDTEFSTYAVLKIRSYIDDGICQYMGISRRLYYRLRQEEGIREQFKNTLGREPTDEEIAFHAGISLEMFSAYRRKAIAVMQGASLTDTAYRIGIPESTLTHKEMIRELKTLVGRLSGEEKALLQHVIGQGDSIRKASRETGISRYRAGRIYKAAIANLRKQMDKKGLSPGD